ncbi:MAG: methionine--tRNA ligase [Thermoprotei archaeon]|nr:MAG: methionine--tRNA ligase [Thermoprotei archaeon]RLF01805.1 MAG: methionine--tRNA ligase [Thermoprotei archaeon]
MPKKERWLVCSAWPYINAIPHLGNMIGSVLSADVYARYLRMRGHEVVFVSGSDEHGTPIEIEAIKRKINPKELTDKNHEIVKSLFERWEISFDNYTRTENEVHKNFVKDFYLKVYENKYVFNKEVEMPYCPRDEIFLPDRFIIGTCPYCGYENARGDQCEHCGRLLNPTLLVGARCAICGAKPQIRKTLHWFFDLPKLADEIKKYIENNKNLPENARNMSLAMIKEGLEPRSLTRDNKWGIPAPFPGAEGKTIYVWMEAVLGYISATIEYFKKKGREEDWKQYWFSRETKSVYFIGKDNIPFHTIIFPALLLASKEPYVLPWSVASTEYLLFEGDKFSKSRRWGIWIDEALELLPADYWRFALILYRPEVRDINFSWKGLQESINVYLNDIIGNFIHRTLTLIWRFFEGQVPSVENPDKYDEQLLNSIKKTKRKAGELIEKFRFREALMQIIELAKMGNKYLNDKQPWALVKTDKAKAGTVLGVAYRIIYALAILLAPFIPQSAQRIWELIGQEGEVSKALWEIAGEAVSHPIGIKKPTPVFFKISDRDLKNLIERLEEIREKGLVPSAHM